MTAGIGWIIPSVSSALTRLFIVHQVFSIRHQLYYTLIGSSGCLPGASHDSTPLSCQTLGGFSQAQEASSAQLGSSLSYNSGRIFIWICIISVQESHALSHRQIVEATLIPTSSNSLQNSVTSPLSAI